MPAATIVIVARDAGRTIGRAVRSAVAEDAAGILLVDDHSRDDTIALAQAVGGGRIEVTRPVEHRTLGFARQSGLLAIRTPYAVWLDADDEFLPGRVSRLLWALPTPRASVAADGAQFVDDTSGALTIAAIPSLLRSGASAVRLFERNYLPGPGVVAVDTAAASDIGFDVSLHGAEDIDFLLRAIAAGQRCSFLDEIGYRCHVSPNSHSRDLERQRAMYRAALEKHDYASVRQLYVEAGEDRQVTCWGLASMAIFREDYGAALAFLTEHGASFGTSATSDGWRHAFQLGTLHLLMGRERTAYRMLLEAERIKPTPEGANNLGVAAARIGNRRRASAMFHSALERYPGYLDARLNLAAAAPDRITSHPLRTHASRQDYRERGAATVAGRIAS